MQSFSIIHPSYLLEMSEGDNELLLCVCETFLTETHAQFTQLCLAAQQQNIQEFRLLRHTLKTSFAIIGVTELCEDAPFLQIENIDNQIIENFLINVDNLCERYTSCCNEITIFIAEIRKKL